MSPNNNARRSDKGKGKCTSSIGLREENKENNFEPVILDSYTNIMNTNTVRKNVIRGTTIQPQGVNVNRNLTIGTTKSPMALYSSSNSTPVINQDIQENISPVQGSCVTEHRSTKRKVLGSRLGNVKRNKQILPLGDITNVREATPEDHRYSSIKFGCGPENVITQTARSAITTLRGKENVIMQSARNLDGEFSSVKSKGKAPMRQINVSPSHIQLPINGNPGPTSFARNTDRILNKFALYDNANPALLNVETKKRRVSYHDMGDPIHKCEHCGAIFWYDERIEKGKKCRNNPLYNNCCMHGKIELPPVMDPPDDFKNLLYGKGKKSKKFQNSIRFYNMIFSFTSMGGKIDNSFNTGRSAPIYRLNGENRHLMGSLMPEDNQKPKFAQLYIFDTENETRNRLSAMRKSGTETDQEDDNDPSIDKEIVCDIKKILDKNNIFVKWFRCSGEILNKYKAADIKLRLVSRRTRDGRVHNLPQASEVAALIVGDVENLENRRDIIIQRKDKSLIRINELHVGYLPLQYPLMFLYGEDGFRDDVLHCETDRSKEKNSKTVTMKEYFSYRLMERATESPHILFGRRLLQQFIVDAYTMVESYRLTFLKHHQQDLRCDSYSALDDALNRGDDNSANTGKRIILPSTFVGGARYMIQNYHDAMTICRWVGYPNLFITFTCNPKWPEIERYVSDRGLYATDRPDIVARVFHAKLDNMMRDIRHDKLFGETSAVIYTIEFQKRGLPHAHILLFLKGYSEHVSADVVDSIISAEIPNESDDEEYYDCVKEYMMHGPCGEYDKKSPCMFGDKCTKHFPKKFVNRTTVDNDGFVMYKRRDEGRKVVKNGIELDNRSVVPHNPVLLKKYNAHINVEWCNRSRSIKYLFKYVHKGNDRTTAVFYKSHEQPEGEKVIDEIKQYLDCRYISASEAAWRLFGYEIHFREPNIVRLGFHLPDEQSIVYKESSSVTEVVTKMSSKETMFTAWLLANTKYQEARNLTYAEMPQKFVWDNETREWRPRKRAFAFGRLSYIFPGSGELYYFRILLNVVRGCTSYEDVRFYNNKLYSSYKEACYARGLLDDDKEYIDAIKEASVWASDQMLRSLFVNMLIHNVLSSPQTVWEECKDEMSVDILSKYRKEMNCQELTLTDDEIHNKCLQYIEDMMKREGRSLKDVNNMPYPTDSLEFPRNSLIAAELSYDKNALRREHEQLVAMLNDEQSNAYNSIVRSLDKAEGQVYFLYGYGGTGKTFVWKTLSAAVRSIGHIVLNVASSGIASLLLPGGRTAHSKFSIPITLHEASTCNITLQSDLAKLIVKTKLIIWDEAPMMHRNCFEALDRTVRDIMKSHQPEAAHMPFGGKVIVFGGDFRQILPVIPKGRREDIVGATINSSPIWRDCKVLRLTKNMRLQNSVDGNASRMLRDFSEWLSCIGDGTLGADNDGEADIEIPEEFLITHSDNHIESIVQATYPSFHEHIGDISFLEGRAILAPTLEDVDRINEYMVSMHNTDEKIYLSSDSIAQSDRGVSMFEQMHSVEFLNTIKCSGLPNHELKLKIGVPIMLLRNMDATNGLCNGTRLVITQLGNHVIEAKVLGGNNSGDHVLIPRIPITPSDTKLPFAFQRRQFPIMISYAMTINKSQGQSLRNVGVFLRKPVFTHGQLYVALSRVTNREGLKLLLCDEKGNLTNKTTNVVYKEVFQNL